MHRIRPHRLVKFFDDLLAKVGVGQGKSLPNIPVSRAGDRDSTRLRQPLQPSGDVHPITEQVSTPDHHIADVDADPELKAAVLRHSGIRLRELLLHRHRALDGIDRARELGQHAIASGIGDPAAMVPNQPVHDLTSGSQGAQVSRPRPGSSGASTRPRRLRRSLPDAVQPFVPFGEAPFTPFRSGIVRRKGLAFKDLIVAALSFPSGGKWPKIAKARQRGTCETRQDMLVLTEEQIRPLLRWDDLIPTMESALAAFSEGRVIQPVRNMITIEEGRRYLGVMPAVAEAAMGLKLVSFYPGNAGTSVPTHLATILLFRPDTGQPLAVMDGRLITEMRTAAVSAAVTKYLSAPESRVLALLGSGVQAEAHLKALSRVRQFDEVRVWSRNPEHARSFAERHNANAQPDARQAVLGADVVVTATSAIGTDPERRLAEAAVPTSMRSARLAPRGESWTMTLCIAPWSWTRGRRS